MSTDSEARIPDETLMAFADGELDDDEAARVERAVNASPALQQRVEMFIATRLQAHAAFGRTLTEPTPDRLLKAATGRLSGHDKTPVAAPWSQPFRIAASVAAMLFMGAVGLTIGRMGANAPATALAGLFSNEAAIAGIVAATPDGGQRIAGDRLDVTINGTYRLADRQICRALVVRHMPSATGAQALACRDATGWKIAGALPAAQQDGQFRPAGAAVSIDVLLDAGGAGEALKREEVEALLQSGWR